MHTIHFCHSFSKLSETFIYDYLTSLQKQGVQIEVITFNHLNKEERPFRFGQGIEAFCMEYSQALEYFERYDDGEEK